MVNCRDAAIHENERWCVLFRSHNALSSSQDTPQRTPGRFASPEGEAKIRVNLRVTMSSQPRHYVCVAAAGTTYSGNVLGGAPCTIV